ncbi:AIM24 family protein, partial [Acetoanaerobium noterae]
MKRAHEVDFKVHGDDMQFVEIQLDQNETIIAEAGAMMYMDQNIR